MNSKTTPQIDFTGKTMLLVITGGIAAYKSLELIRLIKKAGGAVRAILTKSGEQFVTPLSVSALCEHEVYTDLWSLKDETEMGHIRLSRECDGIIIAPASADFIAKMAHGLANDLASTMLLAADKDILVAPAMNHRMWSHPATQDNLKTLEQRGIGIVGPDEGDMACGEFGPGRMSEPEDILSAAHRFFFNRPLTGLKALVTAGPTYEAIDPVRFIGNHSSGKQGYAIADALIRAGADVTLISGPSGETPPQGCALINVQGAQDMLEASQKALPVDIGIFTAAVSDWAPTNTADQKIKKRDDHSPPQIALKENPDILQTIASDQHRPSLVIGFAAETENHLENAQAKLRKKGCDWIIANNVGAENIFGSDENHVYLVTSQSQEEWPRCSKKQVAQRLVDKITEQWNHDTPTASTKHAAE